MASGTFGARLSLPGSARSGGSAVHVSKASVAVTIDLMDLEFRAFIVFFLTRGLWFFVLPHGILYPCAALPFTAQSRTKGYGKGEEKLEWVRDRKDNIRWQEDRTARLQSGPETSAKDRAADFFALVLEPIEMLAGSGREGHLILQVCEIERGCRNYIGPVVRGQIVVLLQDEIH